MALRIKVEDTPNPDAMKFTVGRTLTPDGRPRSFADAPAAAGDPLAAALFALPGVVNVMYVSDFVTVNKRRSARWKDLSPKVRKVLQTHLRG